MQYATKQIKTVLAIVGLSIALLGLSAPTFAYESSNIQAQNFIPYGQIAQEDELYFQHEGFYYVNVIGTDGNGIFMKSLEVDE